MKILSKHQFYDCRNYFITDFRSPSKKYRSLLVVIEKLYLAVIGLGFAPTESSQKSARLWEFILKF